MRHSVQKSISANRNDSGFAEEVIMKLNCFRISKNFKQSLVPFHFRF